MFDMEGGGGGGGEGGHGETGLRFSLRFDPMRAGFDRTLLSLPVSALISRLLGWSQGRPPGSMVVREPAAAAVAVAAATVVLYSAALFVSEEQPRRARRRRLAASALHGPNSAVDRPRALPAPGDGLRIVVSNDGSAKNVIHGTSIGAGDDEPVLVARVEVTPADMDGANADDGEPVHDRSEKEQVKELWLSLLQREQRLELRAMELDGLREQEATVRDLENRVSVACEVARQLELKVCSLQEENGNLKAKVSELDAVRAELGRAKEKLRALKARVQGEREVAQREVAELRERVEELENNGAEWARALAEEAAALRKANAGLEEEKTELALRLQNAEEAAASVNLVLEEDMVEEAKYLRETNERLTRQIEQLHSDHCAHVEDLVYLKWVNACLRHELGGGNGHHHPLYPHQDQQLSAMDLSKSMSYRSSEKAKELMLRYGNLGVDGLSPLNESLSLDGDDHRTRSDHGEPGRSPDTSASAAAPGKRPGHGKLKFLKNIKKLLASSRKGQGHGHDRASKKTTPTDEHLEKAIRWLSSHDALDGDNSYESTPLSSSSCERTPLSSVTTADTHPRARRVEAAAAEPMLEAETSSLSRSKSDAGASYGREASRYHALRPDHPAGDGPDGFDGAPEKPRRYYSDELRSS